MENQHLSVIRVWAALAWADGKIVKQEANAMRRLIEGAAELSDGERQQALSWLETRVDLETANVAGLSDGARQGIYRAAVRLAGIDKDVHADERAFLKRLQDGLKLDDATVQRIEASAAG